MARGRPPKKTSIKEQDEILRILSEQDNNNLHYSCSACQDKGYFLTEENEAILCKCDKDKNLFRRYVDSNIPKIFFNKTLNSDWNLCQDAYGNDLGPSKIKKEKIFKIISKYIQLFAYMRGGYKIIYKKKNGTNQHYNSMILVGEIMSGKTLLASIIAQEAIKSGLNVKFFEWSDLCIKLSDFSAKEEHSLISEDFKNKDLIIIDGVSAYKINSASFMIQLDRLCRLRINSGKMTIITSDKTYKNVDYGQGWKSLISDFFVINLPSPNNGE
jgi:hypothetical protein